MPQLPVFLSIRARLILASLLVQVMILAVLLFNTSRVWRDMSYESTLGRVQELSRLLNATFSGPLAAGDKGKAADLLDGIRTPEGIDYLVLLDAHGRIVAARGWDMSQALPQVEQLTRDTKLQTLIHASTEIGFGGERLGELRFGVSTSVLQIAAERLSARNVFTIVIGLALSVLVMALTSLWLTRHLYRLIDATEQAASGKIERLPVLSGRDEIAQLTQRFNDMALAIKERMQSISREEEKFHAIADYTYSGELWLDAVGKLVWVNASINRLTGYSVNECMLLSDFPFCLAMPEDRPRLSLELQRALTERATMQEYEFRAIRRDGAPFWASMSWLPIYNSQGQYQGLRASIRDNTELKDDRLALRKAVIELRQLQDLGQSYYVRAESERARLMALLSAMRFGVLFLDNENRVVFHNPAFVELWGLQRQTGLIGRPIGQLLQQAENRPAMDDIMTFYLEDLALSEERVDFGEISMNDGRIVTQHCYRVIDQSGVANGRMWVYEDVTQSRQLTERMISLAERDALTGLYNRHRFQLELERMASDADRRQSLMALVFFDLDEFKYVNDTFGHDVGDQLLAIIGSEIGKQIRRHEVLARLGGDEFAVLVPDCNEYEVSRLAERIVNTVSQIQFAVDNHVLRPSTSVGVALLPLHATTPAELVAHADAAMYQAKGAGKSTWRMYRQETDVSKTAIARMSWKDRIMEALEKDGFELHYQGIYHIADRSLAHLEALVRMKDLRAPGGIIYPGNFIPHAETTGKIIEIDRWTITRVIEMLARHKSVPPIAVNISGRSFDEPDLPEFISRLLVRHRVAPERLLVELTETAAVSDMRDAQRFIDALRATGCTVCLDDFGNGFASFAYLKQLKANVLKIDGLFIRDLPNDHDSQVFVRGMAAMAREMGKTTIAEFVETEQIFNMLAEMGIDQAQGYYLDRPVREHPSLAGFS